MGAIDRGIQTASRGLPNRGALAAVIGLKGLRKVTLPARKAELWELALYNNRSRFSINKARRLLTYAPKMDLLSGMQQTEVWLRSQGLLPRVALFGEEQCQRSR